MTVNIISLGCSKNLVDSERLLSQLRSAGYKVLHEDYETPAEIVIINTCGFILDAKEESIDTIFSYIREKQKGKLEKLFVMGCLSERYREELTSEMPEVDGFFGVWELPAIMMALGSSLDRKLEHERILTTPSHYAYLKISEGCNRSCAFCAIPGIRGPQQSLSIEDLVKESKFLVKGGVKEIMVIAQDLTNYGIDLYGKRALADLLKELVKIKDLEWIRLHYAYPTGFPEEVIDLMASEEKICNYMDIPIQHVNNEVLTAMGRGHNRKKLEDLLAKFRDRIPDVALRTTVLTGFPGEGEEEFAELSEFVKEFRFDRLGVFAYSHEEDTPAFELDDSLDDNEKSKRAGIIMKLQQAISLELNQAKVGKEFKVIIDSAGEEFYTGRTQYDSPEVDNEVLIKSEKPLKPGSFYSIRITEADAFDLYGEPK